MQLVQSFDVEFFHLLMLSLTLHLHLLNSWLFTILLNRLEILDTALKIEGFLVLLACLQGSEARVTPSPLLGLPA